jgi:hypothetical protein
MFVQNQAVQAGFAYDYLVSIMASFSGDAWDSWEKLVLHSFPACLIETFGNFRKSPNLVRLLL